MRKLVLIVVCVVSVLAAVQARAATICTINVSTGAVTLSFDPVADKTLVGGTVNATYDGYSIVSAGLTGTSNGVSNALVFDDTVYDSGDNVLPAPRWDAFVTGLTTPKPPGNGSWSVATPSGGDNYGNGGDEASNIISEVRGSGYSALTGSYALGTPLAVGMGSGFPAVNFSNLTASNFVFTYSVKNPTTGGKDFTETGAVVITGAAPEPASLALLSLGGLLLLRRRRA
jgi:hypothetical protein